MLMRQEQNPSGCVTAAISAVEDQKPQNVSSRLNLLCVLEFLLECSELYKLANVQRERERERERGGNLNPNGCSWNFSWLPSKQSD